MSDTAFLQSLLDKGGSVLIPAGNYTVDKTLEIPPYTYVKCEEGCVIRLADGANCPLLMNRFEGTDKPACRITVDGGVWDGNNVGQDRSAYTHPLYSWGQAVCFAATRDLKLINMTIKDPNSFGITLTDTERFTVRDITFDCNCLTGNQDGVHVNGWAKDGYIGNIMGNTNDDMVALNSDEGDFLSPNCDITNVVIDGVYGGDNGWTAVRLLSRNAHLRNISIRNIFGAYKYNAVSFTHWSGEPVGMGHFDNVVIENVFATCCRNSGTGHGGLIWFQSDVSDVGTVIIRNMLRTESEEKKNATCTVTAGRNVKIRRLRVENMVQDIPDGKPLMAIAEGTEIDEFTLDGKKVSVSDYPILNYFMEI